MPKKTPALNLPPADDLFSTQESRDDAKLEKVVIIPRAKIDSFPDHPFLVKVDDSMMALVESVKAVGIQTPATVRPKDGGRYEYVAGHRRDKACELAGIDDMPCIVRQMSRDEAIIAMVESNLQREVILPSEKARSYKMKLDAMKRQAGRPSKNSATVVQNYEGKTSRELLAEKSPDSHEQIRKYIRLNELTPQMLDMVDEGILPMRPAVELSYLPQEQQILLQDVIEFEDRTPSHAEATKIRELSNDGRLDEAAIISIMRQDKPNQKTHFKLSTEKLRPFFAADTSAKVIESTIIKALELWRNRNKQGE